ncbi:MAG: phosphoribosylformylglycinamidine synthase subunit PurS [Candidatus Aenigmarchaeota archaeon]|nr:phosphoribosylformylglycinamidine synthase subunit PurS [Candidatus Aenigmarchaeota archaeon]
MAWIVEVGYKKEATDPVGFLTKKEIEDLGIEGVKDVRTINTYIIDGDISEDDVKKICEELLSDSQIQHFGYSDENVKKLITEHGFPEAWLVEVTFKPGVTDAVGLSTLNAIEIMGIDGVRNVSTGEKYLIFGDVSEEDVEKICKRILANELIQNYSYRKIGGK